MAYKDYIMRNSPLGTNQQALLKHLKKQPQLTEEQLYQALDIERQRLQRALSTLTTRGFVRFEFIDGQTVYSARERK